jgi:hypothetical protein
MRCSDHAAIAAEITGSDINRAAARKDFAKLPSPWFCSTRTP